VDHENCRCNVGHTKESNAEAIRILKSDPTITTHKVPSFPLVHAMIVFFWNIKSGIYVYSEIYFMDCTKSFWLMVCTTKKTFSKVGQVKKRVFTRFLTALMAFTPFFLPSLPINRLISLQFLTSSSFSSSPLLHFYNDVFPSLAFHRKGLFGNPSGVL